HTGALIKEPIQVEKAFCIAGGRVRKLCDHLVAIHRCRRPRGRYCEQGGKEKTGSQQEGRSAAPHSGRNAMALDVRERPHGLCSCDAPWFALGSSDTSQNDTK